MKKLICLAIVSLVFSLGTQASNSNVTMTEFLILNDSLQAIEKKGDNAAENSDFKKAKDYYKQLIDADASNPQFHFKYGCALGFYAKEVSKLKALNLLDEIQYHLKKTIELNEKHIEARHALSQMYCELPGIIGGSYKKASKYAKELLDISPVDGYLALGFIAEYKEDFNDAADYYQKAIDVGKSVTTYRKLILLNEKELEKPKKALKLVKEALSLHPEDEQLLKDKARIEKQV